MPGLGVINNTLSRNLLRSCVCVQAGAMHTLPRLPVPNLHQTLKKYLKSLEPFLLEDERFGGPCYELAFNKRLKWAEKFEEGIGKLCQERLQGMRICHLY